MRIAKPLLLVTTPLGVVTGLFEAYRLTGGMALLMAMMIGLLCVAASSVVLTIRREQRLETAPEPAPRSAPSGLSEGVP